MTTAVDRELLRLLYAVARIRQRGAPCTRSTDPQHTAMKKAQRRGWLRGRRVGRVTFWSLTDAGESELRRMRRLRQTGAAVPDPLRSFPVRVTSAWPQQTSEGAELHVWAGDRAHVVFVLRSPNDAAAAARLLQDGAVIQIAASAHHPRRAAPCP